MNLHSTIDRLLINPQVPCCFVVDCWLIHIAGHRFNAPTNPVPGILLFSLVFCYQIFLWFSKVFLALALHNWYTLEQSLMTLAFYCWLSIDSHRRPISVVRYYWPVPCSAYVVTDLLLSNLPLKIKNLTCTCTPKLLDFWSILNNPGILLWIVDWFPSPITDFVLSPTNLVPSLLTSQLVFYYQTLLWFSKVSCSLFSQMTDPW